MATGGVKGLRQSLHVRCVHVRPYETFAPSDLKFRIKRKNELNSAPLQWLAKLQSATADSV